MEKYLGIDVGAGSIKASLISKNGELHSEKKIIVNRFWSNDEFLSAIGRLVELFQEFTFNGIGIGSPGPLDTEKGIILKSCNFHNLEIVPIVDYLKNKYNCRVLLNNDANCAALGEYYFGEGIHTNNVIVLTLGTGIGGGWVYKGQLFNGYKGNGMELGHITIVKDGLFCECGQKGCAESYFSTMGFLKQYKEITKNSLENGEAFFELLKKKDRICIQIFKNSVSVLSELIRNIIHSINPEKVILVGGLMNSYDLFEAELNDKVKQLVFPAFINYTKILRGKNTSGSFGAATLLFQEGGYL